MGPFLHTNYVSHLLSRSYISLSFHHSWSRRRLGKKNKKKNKTTGLELGAL